MTNVLGGQFKTGSAVTTPFYTNLVQQGLPYFGAESQYATSDLARQANQAKATMRNRLAGFGRALPSGFAEASDRAFDADTARAFDSNQRDLLMQNLQAKLVGAQGLNPLAAGSAALGGNQSIMNAPLRNTFWSNLVGGVLGGFARA